MLCEDQEMLEHLKKHLMPLQRLGLVKIWSDTDLDAGVEWEKELHQHLRALIYSAAYQPRLYQLGVLL